MSNIETAKLYIYFALAAIFFAWTYISVKKDASRAINGFLLEAGALALFFALERLCVMVYTENMALRIMLMALYYLYIVACAALGIFMIINGISCVRREGKSPAHILPVVFGALMAGVCAQMVYDMFGGTSGSETYVFIMSALTNLTELFPFALGGFFLANEIYRHHSNKTEPDYIIIHGCAIRKNGEPTPLLKSRLDKALEVYRASGEKASFITSGGKGDDEIISEAECMKNYLTACGIPEEKIIMENKSVSTWENLKFSMALAEENASFVIATSSYHAFRAKMLAKKLGMKAESVGGKTAKHYYLAAFLREYIAVIFNNKYVLPVYVIICVALATASMIA